LVAGQAGLRDRIVGGLDQLGAAAPAVCTRERRGPVRG
jgi:hypothetical protein